MKRNKTNMTLANELKLTLDTAPIFYII